MEELPVVPRVFLTSSGDCGVRVDNTTTTIATPLENRPNCFLDASNRPSPTSNHGYPKTVVPGLGGDMIVRYHHHHPDIIVGYGELSFPTIFTCARTTGRSKISTISRRCKLANAPGDWWEAPGLHHCSVSQAMGRHDFRFTRTKVFIFGCVMGVKPGQSSKWRAVWTSQQWWEA